MLSHLHCLCLESIGKAWHSAVLKNYELHTACKLTGLRYRTRRTSRKRGDTNHTNQLCFCFSWTVFSAMEQACGGTKRFGRATSLLIGLYISLKPLLPSLANCSCTVHLATFKSDLS